MFRLFFLIVFVSMATPCLSMGIGFPTISLPGARSFSFRELCKKFCENPNSDYWEEDDDYFFRTLDYTAQPRIFCGLCEKKFNMTTVKPTTPPAPTSSSSSPTTTPPTPTSSSSSPTTTPPTPPSSSSSPTTTPTTPPSSSSSPTTTPPTTTTSLALGKRRL